MDIAVIAGKQVPAKGQQGRCQKQGGVAHGIAGWPPQERQRQVQRVQDKNGIEQRTILYIVQIAGQHVRIAGPRAGFVQ